MTCVAFLVDQLFSPAPGGMGTYVRELVPALSRADPSLEIVLFHARFSVGPSQPPGGRWMRGYWVEELGRSTRGLYPGWAVARRPALPHRLAARDLVHTPLPAAIPPAARGQRLVVTVHDLAFVEHSELFPPRWRLMYRLGLARTVRSADAVIAVSRHTAEDLTRRTRIDPARVHVVPEAASLPVAPRDPATTLARLGVSSPYVLFVGTLEPRKNLPTLVRAYRRVAARGLPHQLVLAGPRGWHAAELDRELNQPGAGSVLLTGSMAPEDLDALYRAAAAFVYPSIYEGFGLPVVEAMARGVPCVVSSASSLPEVAGEAALPIDPRSVDGLAEALERVLTDPALAERLRRAGLARAELFSWDRAARETLEVYKWAMDREPRSSQSSGRRRR